jgi:hypothetical protein
LSSELREEIRPLYAEDTALYETARAIFAEQCRAYGDTLEADLARFRRNNAIYGRLYHATERIRQANVYGFIRRMTGGLLRG